MSDNLLSIKALTFSYGKGDILSNLNLDIPQGSIYGYLGKNGAGKTTTINLILKLLPGKAGSIFYKGEDIHNLNENYFRNIGALIQPAPMYKHLTCYEQLNYLCCFYELPKTNIDRVLKDVDLFDHRHNKVKFLSAGMKQRLSIAMALLHNPNLLLFDEPVNGLDPNGMQEFRSLIKTLNEAGKTILISSHILGELEKMCTHIGILNNGTIIFEDSLPNLLNSLTAKIIIRTSDTEQTKTILQKNGIPILVSQENSELVCEIAHDSDYAKITKVICGNNIDIYDISRKEANLESFYLNLTK